MFFTNLPGKPTRFSYKYINIEKTFQQRYVNAVLIEAKRINYTIDELQVIVKEAYQALEDDK